MKSPSPASMTSLGAEELLARQEWLRTLAARLVRDQAERDDLVQETWLAALEHPGTPVGDRRAWLGAILRNRWRSRRRTAAHRAEREAGRSTHGPIPSAADLAEGAEQQVRLVRAVLELEEPARTFVLLRYFGGLSARAIARREGLPEGTVRSRLKRALDRLRDELDRQNGGDRRAWALALVPLARLARTERSMSALSLVTAAALLLGLGIGVRLFGSRATGGEKPLAEAPFAIERPAAAPAAQSGATGDAAVRTPAPPQEAPLPSSNRLELLILDDERRPIAMARVSAGEGDARYEASTDSSGRCRVQDSAWTSSFLHVHVEADGFVHHRVDLARGQVSWTCPQALVLSRATALDGRIVEEETELPLAGAEVRLTHDDCLAPLSTAVSGSDGTFRLDGAPSGQEVELLVRAPDHALVRGRVLVARSAGARSEIRVPVGSEIHGRVVDAWTGAPLANAVVYHQPNEMQGLVDEGAIELTRSDANGELTLRWAGPGIGLRFVASGYCTLRWQPRADDFEVPLLPVGVVEGSVRDVDGSEVANATIRCWGPGGWAQPSSLAPSLLDDLSSAIPPNAQIFTPDRTCTDEHGRFRLEVVPGRSNRILLTEGGAGRPGSPEATVTLHPGETRSIDFVRRAFGTIQGTLFRNGAPSPGRVLCARAGRVEGSEWTALDGTFEFSCVAPGRVSLRAMADESAQSIRPTPSDDLAQVEVLEGATTRVDLPLELPMDRLRGRVRNPAGKPAANRSIAASNLQQGRWHALTDAEGVFELVLPRGQESWTIHVEGGASAEARAGGPEIEIVMPTHGRIRLRALDPDGVPVERVTLHARRSGEEWTWLGECAADAEGYGEWVTETGTLELCAVQIEAGCPPTLLGPYVLEDDRELRIDCRLPRVAETVFVLDPPLEAGLGMLGIEPAESEPLPRGLFFEGVDLRFSRDEERVQALASGRYRVRPTSPRVTVEPAEFELGEERSQPVALTWRRSP